ncbi:MAG TPA: ABC transporter substrate-binding protein [Verrucomicrobiae bacterium]|nr:ABC transporter substrate-binding protein [Verrucomicrobiae bacterium]
MPHGWIRGRVRAGLGALLAISLSLLVVGWGAGARIRPAAGGGTATFALQPGAPPSYIFPLFPSSDFSQNENEQFEWLMWRPLYWFGEGGRAKFNPSLSLAAPPVYSDGGRTVTITLKSYRWSDGRPVTARDVEFWINLVRANRSQWAAYVPGAFPDNLVAVRAPTPRRLVLSFDRAYGRTWLLYNELSQLFPIPQHAWDRTSVDGPVGNADRSAAGARRVYRFLNGQSLALDTYASNPLWQVVDGPWRLAAYAPSTGRTVLAPNPRYSGPVRPHLARFVEVPFTSSSAEFDALRAGELDYGYLPIGDLNAAASLERSGYRLAAWHAYDWNAILLQFQNGVRGAILRQLYIRQALTRAIPMHEIVRRILHGYGSYFAGPVPPSGPFSTAYERAGPYPTSLAKAAGLLADHGWAIHRDGVDRCVRPGIGPGRCGAGIPRAAPLQFRFLVMAGSLTVSAMAQTVQSNLDRIGFALTIHLAPANVWDSQESGCTGLRHCAWDLALESFYWAYAPDYYPTGGEFFETGAPSNNQNLNDPVLDRLITATHLSSSPTALYAYEDYVARTQPMIFMPVGDYQLSLIRRSLTGALPQDPLLNLYPEAWRLGRG